MAILDNLQSDTSFILCLTMQLDVMYVFLVPYMISLSSCSYCEIVFYTFSAYTQMNSRVLFPLMISLYNALICFTLCISETAFILSKVESLNGGRIGVKLKKLWTKYENNAILSEN